MKKILALILVLLMLTLPIISCGGEETKETEPPVTDAPASDVPKTEAPALRESDEALYVGFARELLTPYDENGYLVTGYTLAGVAETRNAVSVKSDLLASCTAVKDKDGNIALLYSLDLHSVTPEQTKALTSALEDTLGIPEENIILNATHTHAAIYAAEIMDILETKLIAAARAAIDDLTLVTALYTGTLTVENMNYIRRYAK